MFVCVCVCVCGLIDICYAEMCVASNDDSQGNDISAIEFEY